MESNLNRRKNSLKNWKKKRKRNWEKKSADKVSVLRYLVSLIKNLTSSQESFTKIKMQNKL